MTAPAIDDAETRPVMSGRGYVVPVPVIAAHLVG